MNNLLSNEIIKKIKKELAETNHFISEDKLTIFKYSDKVTRLKFKKGAEIIKEGDEHDSILFLAKGFLKIFRDVDDKKIFMRMMIPGEFVGLTLLSGNQRYPFSIDALEDSILYYIHKDAITEDVYKNSEITQWVIGDLSKIVSTLYGKIIFLRCKQMNGRIADAILYFADDIFKNHQFTLPITKKQLGHYSNVSPENVSRILKTFVSENIIEIKGKNINIINYERLQQISKIG